MRRGLSRVLLLGMLVGLVVAALRRLGALGGQGCDMGCDCSQAAELCFCNHATCLAPAGIDTE